MISGWDLRLPEVLTQIAFTEAGDISGIMAEG